MYIIIGKQVKLNKATGLNEMFFKVESIEEPGSFLVKESEIMNYNIVDCLL